jgi:hypothetical protein
MAPMKCPAPRQPVNPFEETYSLTHLAHRWGASRREIRQLLQSGDLPFVQVAGQLRVPAASVRKLELEGEGG